MWCETMEFMKTVGCQVRVLEPPLTPGKTVYVCPARRRDKFSRAADAGTSGTFSAAQIH